MTEARSVPECEASSWLWLWRIDILGFGALVGFLLALSRLELEAASFPSAGAWAERGRGRWLEHDGSEPARVALPSQKGRTCVDFAARLGRGVGGAWAGEVAGT